MLELYLCLLFQSKTLPFLGQIDLIAQNIDKKHITDRIPEWQCSGDERQNNLLVMFYFLHLLDFLDIQTWIQPTKIQK